MRKYALVLFAVVFTVSAGWGQSVQRSGMTQTIEFDTDEGTLMNVALSPDGRTILFDLLGDLYTIPISGGTATLLIGGRSFEANARYSPDGKHIAFVSDREGSDALWIASSIGTNWHLVQNQTNGEPAWSSPGVAISDDANVARAVDGSVKYVAGASGLLRIGPRVGDSTLLRHGSILRPKLSPNGRYLAYAIDTTDAEQVLCIRDLTKQTERCDGKPIDQFASSTGAETFPNYAFFPDGQSLVISVRGKIARIDVASLRVDFIPMHVHVRKVIAKQNHVAHRVNDSSSLTIKAIEWPSIAPGGRTAALTALGHIYIADLVTGRAHRLTDVDEQEYWPTYSPDGRWIAYVAWSDANQGTVVVRSLLGDTIRRLTKVPGTYASPAWSPDGQHVAFAQLRDGDEKTATGMTAFWVNDFDVLYVDLVGGAPVAIAQSTIGAPFLHGFRFDPVIAFANINGQPRIFYTGLCKPYVWSGSNGGSTLFSVGLNGGQPQSHLHVDELTDELVPSPDGRFVAIGRDGRGVWITALPRASEPETLSISSRPGTSPETLIIGGRSSAILRLSAGGGYHITWRDSATVAWVYVNEIFWNRPTDGGYGRHHATITIRVPRPRPRGMVAFTNARIVTMRGGGGYVIEHGTLLARGNRIVAVGPTSQVRVPVGTVEFDATGRTIIPGLIGVHDHHQIDARIADRMQQQRWQEASSLAFGVTTIFDPAALTLDVIGSQERVEAGQELGARVFSTGEPIFGVDSSDPDFTRFRSLPEARRVVAQRAAFGIEMIKEYVLRARRERQLLAEAAREEHIMLTAEGHSGHRELAMDLQRVSDGYTFEHCVYTRLYSDVLEFFARSGMHYTPTLNVCSPTGTSLVGSFHTRDGLVDAVLRRSAVKDARFAPPGEAMPMASIRDDSIPEYDRWWLGPPRAIAEIAHRGGYVSISSHGGSGLKDQLELWALTFTGMSNLEALRAATWSGAHKIGYESDLGSLEVGKLADFLVLDADPLQNIRNTLDIRFTVKNGVVYDPASLTELWPSHRTIAPFFWQAEATR
jgi:Tol biopolymer transport system component